MSIPKELKYTKDHEWLRVEGEYAYIGITDFAQSQLGDIVFVDISENGLVEQEEVFGTIEAVKTVSDLFMPIYSEVIEVNSEIENNPAIINEDPYGKGWIIKVKIQSEDDMKMLLDATQYQDIID